MPTLSLEVTNNGPSRAILSSQTSSVVLSIPASATLTFELSEDAYGDIIEVVERASQEVLPGTSTKRIEYTLIDPRNAGTSLDPDDYEPAANIVLRETAKAPAAFDTIQEAIDAASAGSEIVLGPVEFQENLTINKALRISTRDGIPGSAAITGPGGNGATLTLSAVCDISNLLIRTPDNAVGITTTHAAGVTTFRTCTLEPQGTGGTCLRHTGNGVTRVMADSFIRSNACQYVFDLDGDGRLVVLDTAMAQATCKTFAVVRGGSFRAESARANATQFVIFDNGVLVAGDADVVLQQCDFSGARVACLHIATPAATINVQDSDLRGEALDVLVDAGISGVGAKLRIVNTRASRNDMALGQAFLANAEVGLQLNTDRATGDPVMSLYSEFSVGYPETGFESAFGTGDSYTRGMRVFTATSGGVFAEVSSAASTAVSSTFSFSDNGVGAAIYVASTLPRTADGAALRHHGVKYDCVTAGVPGAGRIAIEYWNGSQWVEIEGMVTDDRYPHLSRADKYFQETGNFHLRHRHRANLDWAASDPVGLGTAYFWKRYRIVGAAYTTPPVFERFKLHGDYVTLGEDGFREYYGACRVIKRLPIDISDVQGAAGSPGNQDLYFSDTLPVGRIENSFPSNSLARIGISTYLPYDIDTSNGIRFIWTVASSTAAGAGTEGTKWRYRYDVLLDGEAVYSSTAAAPDATTGQRTVEYTGSMPLTANTLRTFSTFIDVRDIIARTGPLGDPPLLVFSLERDPNDAADTFGGSVTLVTFGAFYATWCDGASLSTV